ncbi:hypothetical protein HY468_02135 [Candidatus Roizmanbacteria bacterium]|nr:hypothetical protein [Candidatus Roizmanbacteria bacterium]
MPPDADQSRRQPLSSEVIGRFTSDQERELVTLFGAVFQKKELDPQNKDHVEEVGEIVRDCVMRGVQQRGKVWIGPCEHVSRYFEQGFRVRQSIVDQLYEIGGEGRSLEYATVGEEVFTSSVSPYDRDFTTHEQLLAELQERKKSIASLHHALFEEPPLGEQVQEIVRSLDPLVIHHESEQDAKWIKYNMVFGNFLVHLAFYQRPGVAIEPQDIAALADLWNKGDWQISQQKLKTAMADLAQQLNLPEGHVMVYTDNILENMNLALGAGQVTIDNLARGIVFAISDEQLLQYKGEVLSPLPQKKAEVTSITTEELQNAHEKASEVLEKYVQLSELAGVRLDELGVEHEADQTAFERYMSNEYTPALTRLTPLELYATYYQILQKDSEIRDTEEEFLLPFFPMYEDLQSSVSVTTYADALRLIERADFPDKISVPVQHRMEQFVLDMLSEDRIQDSNLFLETVARISFSTLNRYLSTIEAGKMDTDRLNTLLALDEEIWFALAEENDVEVEQLMNGENNFVFTGSDYLRGYFDRMPPEKRASLQRRLLQEIDY